VERKSFQKYLERRLTKREIVDIERQAKLEKKILESLQEDIASAVNRYMKKHKVGFNELVELLDVSPTHISKIQKREANLTLSSLAHIFALIDQEPHLVFKKK
jgi:transcriptional regulator with XRE-family HTH domain